MTAQTTAKQISFFDRVIPKIRYHLNREDDGRTKTQGYMYCSACGRWVGCGGMFSWLLSEEEMQEEAKHENVSIPNSPSGYCFCGVYIWGDGCEYDGHD